MEDEMSSEQRDHETVAAAFDWLYADGPAVTSTMCASPADAKCTYCQGDGYINVHANLPDVKCEICGGSGVALSSTDEPGAA